MKKILHPTDFSPNASRALKLAHALAQKHEAELVVVHIGDLPTILNSEALASFPAMEEEKKAALAARLQAYCSEHIPVTPQTVPLKCKALLHGSIVKGLLEFISGERPNLVVIGAHGKSRLKELVTGSVTRYLITHAPCPVLTVPGKAAATGSFRHIVYASDYDVTDKAIVSRLAAFAACYEATITVLHVFAQPAGNESQRTTFQDRLSRQVAYPHLRFATRVSSNATRAIAHYVEEDSTDLLVMYERDHGLLGNLFHRDKVQHLALHTAVPLLSYNKLALGTPTLKATSSF